VTSKSVITDEMRGIVGKVMAEQLSFPIDTNDIRHWAAAVYYPDVPPPLYWDEEFARTTKWGGIVAPEEFNPFAWMMQEPRPQPRAFRQGRFERAFGLEPPKSKATMQNEIRVTYTGVRMRPGDVIRSTQRISEYFEREGRMGLQLYTTLDNEYTNQHGERIKLLQTVYVRFGFP
jgi:hypothetical protein